MNREPPKNVYSNNRLRKTAPAADQTSSRHPQPTSITTTNNNMRVVNKPQDVKVERSLHFNKSQSKYEKHFEPNAPTNKTLALKKLNEGPGVRNYLLNLKNPSRQGDLGIPLAHNYVRRKVSGDNVQSLQPPEKKPNKNVDPAKQHSSFDVNHDRLHSNLENPSLIPFQDGVRNDLSYANECFQGVKTAFVDTFEEIVKDQPNLLTAALKDKEELLQKLRSYVKRQEEQEVLEEHSNIDGMDECISESDYSYSVYSGGSVVQKTPQPFNKTTPNFGMTARTSSGLPPLAGRFTSHPTPGEFPSRFQREMSSNGSDPSTSAAESSKDRILSLNQHRPKDYSRGKTLVLNRDNKVPYYPQYPDYSSSHLQDHSNNRPPYQ